MLKKDLLELYLLQTLSAGDQYGYQLLGQVHDAFPDTQESAVYALLRGLCREGMTEWYYGKDSGGPARKYYRLTSKGEAQRQTLSAVWQAMKAALERVGL